MCEKNNQILFCCILTMILIINKTSQLLISLSYLTLPTAVELQNSLFRMCVTHMHVKDAGKHMSPETSCCCDRWYLFPATHSSFSIHTQTRRE